MAASLTDSMHHIKPVCQNCQTSTTPLWRRDEIGSVLCNACGLFLKLHGRPRPISLKTDVIKSRNRVKTGGQGPKKKVFLQTILQYSHRPRASFPIQLTSQQSLFDPSTLSIARSDAGTPPLPQLHHQQRRPSQKTSSGASDRSASPISRINTPSLHNNPNIAPQHLFDNITLGVGVTDPALHHSPSLPALHLSHPSPGSSSSLNDRHLEPPQTYEGLLALNTSLKTRVSELEIINDLFKGRVSELEQSDANARRSEMLVRESENRLRRTLEEALNREEELKRRVTALVTELQRNSEEDGGHRAKRARVEDATP
jgi:GATA-binding protein